MHLTNKHWSLYFCTALFCHVAILSAVYYGSQQDSAATQYSQTITTYFSFVNSNPKTPSPSPSPASARGEQKSIVEKKHPLPNTLVDTKTMEQEHSLSSPSVLSPRIQSRGTEQKHLLTSLPSPASGVGGEGRSKLLAMLHIAIQEKQTYPLQAALSQESGTAIINFSLLPSGKIIDAMVVKSSGSQTLDQAALDAVQAISPFKTILTTAKKDLKVAVSFALSS